MAGRPRRILTEREALTLDILSKAGAPIDYIASTIGVSRSSIYKKKEWREVYKAGQATNNLYLVKCANRMAETHPQVLLYLLKCKNYSPKIVCEVDIPDGATFEEKSAILDKALFSREMDRDDWERISTVMLKRFEAIELGRRVTALEEQKSLEEKNRGTGEPEPTSQV
jgi:hypothetical protein